MPIKNALWARHVCPSVCSHARFNHWAKFGGTLRQLAVLVLSHCTHGYEYTDSLVLVLKELEGRRITSCFSAYQVLPFSQVVRKNAWCLLTSWHYLFSFTLSMAPLFFRHNYLSDPHYSYLNSMRSEALYCKTNNYDWKMSLKVEWLALWEPCLHGNIYVM